MSYEREDDPLDLQQQLESQLNQPQPIGGVGPVADLGGGRVPGQESYGFGLNADRTPAVGPTGSPALPPSANPTAGAASMAPPRMAGGALARYGTADIEGAGDLRTGSFGGEGFSYADRAARGERGANTIKNSFGKIASRYDPTKPGAARSVMADPDFQRLFPEATIVEHPNGDLIDFGDGKPVDVLRAARAGGAGEAWQWGVEDDAAPAQQGGGGGINLQALAAGIGGGADPMAAIQAELQRLTGGQDEQSMIQQLLSQGVS